MYESYWQLDCKPFEPAGEAPWYYPSEVHQGALLKLRYALESGRAAALITGPTGLGKSMLIGALKKQLADRCSPFAHLVLPQMSTKETLAYIANELGCPLVEPTTFSIEESLRRIQVLLADISASGKHAVIALDEAHLLADSPTLETVRLLVNLSDGGPAKLSVLLVGQTAILPALERHPGLEERLSVKVLLRPFTVEETSSYILHRLTAAGARHEIFSIEALSRIHELTGGNPRRINRLCDLVLLIGFAEERQRIGAAQVEQVCGELVTVCAE
jgi:general secretion pathway protein A